MSKLIIVPLNTTIERPTLEEVARVTGHKFQSRYTSITLLDYQVVDRSSNPRLFSPLGMSETYGLSVHNFMGDPSVHDYLRTIYGDQDVLAITDLPIVVLGGTTVHGQFDPKTRKAIVSKFSIRAKPDFAREALIAESLHETGHMVGLDDHLAQLSNGKYCVMAQLGMIAREVTPKLDESEIYQIRDNQFCHNCEKNLRNPPLNYLN